MASSGAQKQQANLIYKSENWGVRCTVLTTGRLMGSYTESMLRGSL